MAPNKHNYTIGNAAETRRRHWTEQAFLSESQLKMLRAKYSAQRDPYLVHDPRADVEFEDFIHNIAVARSQGGKGTFKESRGRRNRIVRGLKNLFESRV